MCAEQRDVVFFLYEKHLAPKCFWKHVKAKEKGVTGDVIARASHPRSQARSSSCTAAFSQGQGRGNSLAWRPKCLDQILTVCPTVMVCGVQCGRRARTLACNCCSHWLLIEFNTVGLTACPRVQSSFVCHRSLLVTLWGEMSAADVLMALPFSPHYPLCL